ncbi:MAG: TrmH family RNA methyltransferase [Bacteroidota bacterium]
MRCPMPYRKKSMEELRRLSPVEYATAPKIPLALVLDDIRSANNVGSLFRTADCFALVHVYLCGITAQPPHRDILKTALGATETVSWSYHQNSANLVFALTRCGIAVHALEQTEGSVPLREFAPALSSGMALVVGNEVKGVQQTVLDLCTGTLEIAQYGTKHSLNVAVAGGMAIYELSELFR